MSLSDAPHLQTLTVGLDARAYDIHIGPGLIDGAGAAIAPLLKRPKTVVISDETVFNAQGERLMDALEAEHIETDALILPPGEATKSFGMLEEVLGRLLDLGVERNDIIIALGGGVIGDLTGFASAILRRGCRFVQIPTSLLAQVDSAVGGKTGINAPQGKNLIGAFHQPALVLADTDALKTLSPRQMRAGYAEIVKYAALGDAVFFDWLEANAAALLAGDAAACAYAVHKSLAMKAEIVEEDERERGRRALLNLGHTFGHALEAAFSYSEALFHGEAVAAGMGLAMDYSVAHGACSGQDAERLKAHLRAHNLPSDISDIKGADAFSANMLIELMMQDKKVEAGALTLILTNALGEAYIERNVDIATLTNFMKTKTSA